MKILTIKKLSKGFGGCALFTDLSFDFPSKGFYALVGPSGSGKTTLLEIMSGLIGEYDGSVSFLGRDYKSLTEDKRSELRLRKIGLVRQSYELLELESALQNVLLSVAALPGPELAKARKRALDLLSGLGLSDKAKQKVSLLSGGEKERVAFARALIGDPPLILADEPTGALDKKNAAAIFSYLLAISKKRLVIMVSHDERLIGEYDIEVLRLQNGQLVHERKGNASNEAQPLLAYSPSSLPPKIKASFFYWLSHAYREFKAKRLRSFLNVGVLSFSLLSLGLSLYVKRDLGVELTGAFSSVTGSEAIVVEKASSGESSISKLYSASKEETEHYALAHPLSVKDYGLSYRADFESFFPDKNEGDLVVGHFSYPLKGLSIRSVADFLWLDEFEGKTYYPSLPDVLEESDIVLGLPYEEMAFVASKLGVLRSYEAIGEYLTYHPLSLLLRLENDDWTYEDEQVFSIKAITEDSLANIYQYNHRFNEYVLEEKMRFPSSDHPDSSLPWILNKVYYLEPSLTPYEFMVEARKEEDYTRYVFERASYLYERTHTPKDQASALSRFYLFVADKHSLSPLTLNEISSRSELKSMSVYGEGSYAYFPSAMASGFSSPFFLSNDEMSLAGVTEKIASADLSSNATPILPSNVVEGHYLLPQSSGLTLSSDFSELKEGREPRGEEEVVLSDSLNKKLSNPKEVFVAGVVGSREENGKNYPDYRYGSLKVVGVSEGENDKIFAEPYWSIDFFRDVLGMSSFALEPTKASWTPRKEGLGESLLKSLGASYPDLSFSDPYLTISTSVSDVVGYVETVLIYASGMSLLGSILLLSAVLTLGVLENKREGKLLYNLGFSRGEIADSYGAYGFILVFLSLAPVLLSMAFLEFSVDRVIKGNFGLGGSFVFDPFPLLMMLLAAAVALAVISLFSSSYVRHRHFEKEGR